MLINNIVDFDVMLSELKINESINILGMYGNNTKIDYKELKKHIINIAQQQNYQFYKNFIVEIKQDKVLQSSGHYETVEYFKITKIF